MTTKYWLMKTEPDTFSWEDLLSRPSRREGWEGVRNYQARNFMRDEFAEGQQVFIYHSRSSEPGIVGIAKIVRTAYPDQTALNPESPYFDPKSASIGQSRWVMVDVEAFQAFARPVSLRRLRGEAELSGMALVQPGQRLSIQPVRPAEWLFICAMEPLVALI